MSIPVIILPTLLYVADIGMPPTPIARPLCLLIGAKGTGIAAVYTLTLIRQDIVFNLEQERITNAFFSCTLAVNALCTGMPLSSFTRISRGQASFDQLCFLRTDRVSDLADSTANARCQDGFQPYTCLRYRH